MTSRRNQRELGAHYGHGWLAAVVPAHARRFRIVDRDLAASLAVAGAELVESSPEVDIAPAVDELLGDAALAVVTVEPAPRAGLPPLVIRAGRRLGASLWTRLRAAQARRRLRRCGYEVASVLLWDVGRRIALPGMRASGRGVADRLPQRALVIGRRGRRDPSALEAALAAAERTAAVELGPRWASIRAGIVILAADGAVLRTAIGRGRSQIENQVAAIDALRRAEVPPTVAERVPWLLGHGRVGLAEWSLERLLPGARPPRELTPQLLEECVDFLVALRRAGGGATGGRSLATLAEAVAPVCLPKSAAVVRTLGERLERELAGLPRGFAHGDFFAGNLLADSDRLTGVLDWDGGGPGRLPLVDLLHLQLTRVPYGGDDEWGRALLERLLPSARRGGDAAVRRYCGELGIESHAQVLEALVFAYWLEYAAYQLRTHHERRAQPVWIEGNVELVLREVELFVCGRKADGTVRAPVEVPEELGERRSKGLVDNAGSPAKLLESVKAERVDAGASPSAASIRRVSVMAPMWNEAEHIEDLAADIAGQDFGGEVELLVADGRSTDGSADRLRAAAERYRLSVTILDNPARWVPHALNMCVRAAQGDLIVRVDCHSRYPPDYLRRCVLAAEETGAANVGGVFVPEGRTRMERAVACAMDSPFGGIHWTRHGSTARVEVDTVPYGAFRPDAFRRAGLFDEAFVRNQDEEFNLRLRLAGGRVVQDSSIRIHYTPRGSLARVFRQYYEYGLWKPAVMRKHGRATSARSLVPVAFVISILLLSALAPWLPAAAWLLVAEVGAYAAGAVGFGVAALRRKKEPSRLLPRVVAVFPTFHVAHGLGMLAGWVRAALRS